jgi:hypothetical protein
VAGRPLPQAAEGDFNSLSPVPYSLFPRRGAYNLTMESFLIFVLFLVVWFLVLPRIPGISRFT